MASKAHLTVLMAAALLLVTAGLAAAEGASAPRSIWGTDNPGEGASHSAKPLAGATNNNAGAPHTDNRGGNSDEPA